MASYSIKSTGSTAIVIRINTSQPESGDYYRVFCRLTSDSSSSVYDEMHYVDPQSYLDVTIDGLSPGTSYTLNVGYASSSTTTSVTWLGSKTFTTNSQSTTTTYYYRCYDETNSTYLTSSTSTTSSSVTRPSRSGYVYVGYKRGTSFSNALSKTSYTGTGTSGSFTSSQKYIVFCYMDNSGGGSSSSSWSWSSSYNSTYTSSTSFSFSLAAGIVGYTNFKAPSNGTLKVYTTGSSDTYGWLTNGGCSLGSGSGSSALSNGTVYTKDDDSGTDSNFSYSYDVTSGTTYEIDWHNYSVSTAASGTLYIVFTPAVTTYTVTCKDRKYNSSGTLLSTTTQGTKSYASGSTAKGSDWGTTSPFTGYYYSSCTTKSSVTAATTVYRNFYPNSYTVSYNVNGGTGTIGNTSRYYNEAYTLTTSQPTRTFYRFLGWGTSASATTALAPGASVAASTSTSTITYYAIWEQDGNVYLGVDGEWILLQTYYGTNGEWVPMQMKYGANGIWEPGGGNTSSTPTLISFTIDDPIYQEESYQAEDGMTWEQWCSSSYNTNGFWCDDYDVMNEYSLFLYNSSSFEGVRPSDTIISGGSYYIE